MPVPPRSSFSEWISLHPGNSARLARGLGRHWWQSRSAANASLRLLRWSAHDADQKPTIAGPGLEILMLYSESNKVIELKRRLQSFMDRHVYPNEERFYQQAEELGPWKVYPVVEELKPKARAEGLWNLFLPESEHGAGLTNLEYAPLCEMMGRSHLAPELFNCSAPDTGNMEVLARYGTKEHQERWLKPLLAGEIRSCFAMTEPAVASSDATNIESSIVRQGDEYVINGRKWWCTGAGDPRCRLVIFMGKTNPAAPPHQQQSMILVPMDAPGVKIERMLTVFGYDHAPHGHGQVT